MLLRDPGIEVAPAKIPSRSDQHGRQHAGERGAAELLDSHQDVDHLLVREQFFGGVCVAPDRGIHSGDLHAEGDAAVNER